MSLLSYSSELLARSLLFACSSHSSTCRVLPLYFFHVGPPRPPRLPPPPPQAPRPRSPHRPPCQPVARLVDQAPGPRGPAPREDVRAGRKVFGFLSSCRHQRHLALGLPQPDSSDPSGPRFPRATASRAEPHPAEQRCRSHCHTPPPLEPEEVSERLSAA